MTMMIPVTNRRTLIVEDDDLLRRAMARELAHWSAHVEHVGTIAEARKQLSSSPPDLVLLDVRLPDGNGLGIAKLAARLQPKPRIIALSGQATATEAFELALAGVCAFLPKPISLSTLCATLELVLSRPFYIDPFFKDLVGVVSLHDARDDLRRAMVVEALARAGGNKTRAAEILGVTRQAVQQMIRDLEIDEPDETDELDEEAL